MAMSVSSMEPIIDDSPRTLNRTESFNGIVLEDRDRKRIMDQLVNIKRYALISYVIIAILSVISIYAVITLNHVQKTFKNHDDYFKEIQKMPFKNDSVRKDLHMMHESAINLIKLTNNDIEKLKVSVNTRINIMSQKIDALDNVKSEVKINAYKTTNLENRLEQILLMGILKGSNQNEKVIIPDQLTKNSTSNEPQNKSSSENSRLILLLNSTLVKRVDELDLQMQDMHQKIEKNSNLLSNISRSSRVENIKPFIKSEIKNQQPCLTNNTGGDTIEMLSIVNNIRDSIDKLRFGRRGKY